jgi:N-carbamoyl-L-amino-acid hydrolase
VFTAGELSTNPLLHAPSKVAGETRFVLDFRSTSEDIMREVVAEARAAAARIGDDYRVRFDLGDTSDSPAAVMDPRLRAALKRVFDQPFDLPSGAGHDAAVFAGIGIPSAMIFVRNDHGSHNPQESMDMPDFAIATRGLLRLLDDFPF